MISYQYLLQLSRHLIGCLVMFNVISMFHWQKDVTKFKQNLTSFEVLFTRKLTVLRQGSIE